MGYLHFYSLNCSEYEAILTFLVLVPYGVSTFLFVSMLQECDRIRGSRPLWGIYISIQYLMTTSPNIKSVLVPYGVSTFLFRIKRLLQRKI